MYKSNETSHRENTGEPEWLIVNTPDENGGETEDGKVHDDKSNNEHQPDEADPSLVSEIAEKSGPLSAEDTEKLLEWLKLGSRCIKIRLSCAFE